MIFDGHENIGYSKIYLYDNFGNLPSVKKFDYLQLNVQMKDRNHL